MTLCIGIRREDKNQWEARVPLTPEHVRQLKAKWPIDVFVQPSPIRAFPDAEYERAGAVLSPDLSVCPVILGVKEVPEHLLEPEKTYIFFSHVIKGQPYNMTRLKRMMDLRCQLIDYECVTDDRGARLIAFGYFAGLAGIVETLNVLGKKLALQGLDTPFSMIKHAYAYADLDDTAEALERVGERLKRDGLPTRLRPMIFGFSGYGKVSTGAQEFFDRLGVVEIDPGEIPRVFARGRGVDQTVYKAVFKEEHLVRPKDPNTPFDLQTYYASPELFDPIFERSLPFLTVLVNCIYWDERFPRLVTRDTLSRIWQSDPFALNVIGDISCDIEGAIEITHRATEPDQPSFTYLPDGSFVEDCVADGISVMAVDNLPCEFPKASSRAFGDALLPFVAEIAAADFDRSLDTSGLPPALARATILHRGALTPPFAYLEEHVQGVDDEKVG